MRHRSFWSVACGAVLLALAGCGDDTSGSQHGFPGASSSSGSSVPTNSASSSANEPAGNFKHTPGQAGQVQQTLTAAGFECTRHSDHSIDLRLCSKGIKQPDRGQFGGPSLVGASMRFYSAPDGTVLFAKIVSDGDSSAKEFAEMQLQLLKSVLPAQDAAVVAADGDTLTWGSFIKDPGHTPDGWLLLKGFEPTKPEPVGKPLSITKEQALTKLAAEKFKCSFGDPADYQSEGRILTCYSQSTDSTDSDESIAGATATLQLEDTGSGITGIVLKAQYSKTAINLSGVKHTAPKLSALGDTTLVPALQDWIAKHLDGVPHEAYVGDNLVGVSVVDQSLTGAQVYLRSAIEEPLLGYDPSKIEGN